MPEQTLPNNCELTEVTDALVYPFKVKVKRDGAEPVIFSFPPKATFSQWATEVVNELCKENTTSCNTNPPKVVSIVQCNGNSLPSSSGWELNLNTSLKDSFNYFVKKGGGIKSSPPKKTHKKIKIGNVQRCIYVGPRGGEYVRLDGKFKRVSALSFKRSYLALVHRIPN